MLNLSDENRAVLAHIVLDPDAWLAHAAETFGAEVAAEHLAAKVARWTKDYESAKAELGGEYKTRAEREGK